MPKRISLIISIVIVMAVLIGMGTMAWFTDQVGLATAPELGAGTLMVDIADFNENAEGIAQEESLEDVQPGDNWEYDLEITNAGTLDLEYRVMLFWNDETGQELGVFDEYQERYDGSKRDDVGTHPLSEVIEFSFYNEDDDEEEPVYSGTLEELDGEWEEDSNAFFAYGEEGYKFKANGENQEWTIEASFPTGHELEGNDAWEDLNKYQGSELEFFVKVSARQVDEDSPWAPYRRPYEYKLNLEPNLEGYGVVSGAGVYGLNDEITLKLEDKEPGAEFLGWAIDDEILSEKTEYTFILDDVIDVSLPAPDLDVMALFEGKEYTVELSLTPQNYGEVHGAGTYMADNQKEVTVKAEPYDGYIFMNWTEDGDEVSDEDEYSFVTPIDEEVKDRNLVANFKKLPYFEVEITDEFIKATGEEGEGVSPEDLDVNANIMNTGDFEDTQTVELYNFYGNLVDYEELSLDSGENQDVTLTWSAQDHSPATGLVSVHSENEADDKMATITEVERIEGPRISGDDSWETGSEIDITYIDELYVGFEYELEGDDVFLGSDSEAVIDVAINKNGTTMADYYNSTDDSTIQNTVIWEAIDVSNTVATTYAHLETEYNSNFLRPDTESEAELFWLEYEVPGGMVDPPEYEIELSAQPVDGGSVSGAGTYEHGQTVTVEADAADGYSFEGWMENGEVVSTDAQYSFMANEDRFLNASFVEVVQLVKTVPEAGSVPPEAVTVAEGHFDRDIEIADESKIELIATNVPLIGTIEVDIDEMEVDGNVLTVTPDFAMDPMPGITAYLTIEEGLVRDVNNPEILNEHIEKVFYLE